MDPITLIHGLLDKDKPPYCARYKNRVPNPGECRVLSINWEEGRVEMSNGACRYYPSFDEIEIYKDPHPLIEMMKKIRADIDEMSDEEFKERFVKPEITTREAVERLGTIRGHKYMSDELFHEHQYLASRLEEEGELTIYRIYEYRFNKQEYQTLYNEAFGKQLRKSNH